MKRTNYLTTLLSLLFLLPVILHAQEEQWKLLGVSVTGNERTDAGLIIATSGFVVGDKLTGDKIQTAIRSLWALGLFDDVRIAVDQSTEAGLFLVIQVKEAPRLEFVDINGGKKLGEDEVEKAIDLSKGQVLKPSDPIRLKRKLTTLATEKGYLLAEITVEIRDGSNPSLKTLSVKIDEGKKVKIKSIEFEGNSAFNDKKLRKQLKNTKEVSLFRSGEFKVEKFREDLDSLISFYREQGYRDFRIKDDSTWYSEDRKRLFIQVEVDEGDRYYFGNVKFEGNTIFEHSELMSRLLFRPGEPFNQKKFDISLQERLSNLYYDRGNIYAQIQPVETPRGRDTLDITYRIEPGNRFSVRKINISGNNKTREKVIRREFSLKPGDTFDVSKLRRSIRDVTILNYFADVRPDIEDVSDSEVDLYVKVEEKPTDQANVSAGYSERDGLIGAIGFTAPNLFGTGQQLNFDWNFGQQYGSFSVSYTEPWLFDTETLIGVSFYNQRRRWVDGFTENLLGGSLRTGRRFRWPDDYFRGDWIYRYEQSRLYDFSETFRERNLNNLTEGETRHSSGFTQIVTRDSRDFPEFPTSGSVFSLTTELAGGPLGGDDRYHKHVGSLEWYSPVMPKVVLYNSFTIGYLDALSGKSKDIPLLKYFYMGGAGLSLGTSLRGYDERTVGPPPSSGTTALGGRSQLKFGSEVRVQIVDNPTIYGLAFAEAGNTWLTFRQTDPTDLKRSLGFGIRLHMPMIGLIGLDYGYGFDYFDSHGMRKGKWLPHFQFGRQF
jgi:outer membrane protein insertion porin family